MRKITVHSTINYNGATLRKIRINDDEDSSITDETRNTVYNILRIKKAFVDPTYFTLDVSLLDSNSLLV